MFWLLYVPLLNRLYLVTNAQTSGQPFSRECFLTVSHPVNIEVARCKGVGAREKVQAQNALLAGYPPRGLAYRNKCTSFLINVYSADRICSTHVPIRPLNARAPQPVGNNVPNPFQDRHWRDKPVSILTQRACVCVRMCDDCERACVCVRMCDDCERGAPSVHVGCGRRARARACACVCVFGGGGRGGVVVHVWLVLMHHAQCCTRERGRC